METVAGLRDRGMLEVLYSTGIRRQELINLRIDDINASAGVLAVRQGKGNKDRFVPIGERALAAVQHYLEDGRPLLGPRHGEDRVFLDDAGQAWEPNRLSRLIKKYIDKARVGKSGSCHLFRHSVATLMLENGADIRFVQQLLGHASINTTEIYTHVAIHQLKDVHQLTHPANRPEEAPESDQGAPTAADLLSTLAEEAAQDGD